MSPQPFTWEAYSEELARDPAFNLFGKFSFDHLSQAERYEIRCRILEAGEALLAEADALKAEYKARQRSRVTVIEGGAA